MKIYKVDFEGIYPVGNCLILAARNMQQAEEMARETITHTSIMKVEEVKIDQPKVIEYLSGDY